MKTTLIEAVMGAIVLAVAVFFLTFAYTSSQNNVLSGYHLWANFDRIDGLLTGNDVRVSGVKVGSVSHIDIDPATYMAKVTLNIRDDLQVPKDTVAEIISESLMGGKYVALVPGGDDQMLQANQQITYTQAAVSWESLIGKFLFSDNDEDKKKPGHGKPSKAAENTDAPAP